MASGQLSQKRKDFFISSLELKGLELVRRIRYRDWDTKDIYRIGENGDKFV